MFCYEFAPWTRASVNRNIIVLFGCMIIDEEELNEMTTTRSLNASDSGWILATTFLWTDNHCGR